MATEKLYESLDRGNPTDVPMRLGQLKIGSQLRASASLGLDSANRTVTSHVCLLVDSSGNAEYGHVLAVQATTGGTTGPCAVILTGTPTTGQVLIEDAGNGQPRLTFAAADAVTACRVQMIKSVSTRDGTSMQAALEREVG
jgi:hypothetical protein